MAKGDSIAIGVRSGDGNKTFEVTARQNGRNVSSAIEKDAGINWLVVREMTRGGTIIEEVKVQISEVIVTKTTRKDG